MMVLLMRVLPFLSAIVLACGTQAAEVSTSVPAKNVSTWKFMSKSLDQERAFNVIVPADYETSTRRYPVLYLLHGYGDDQSAWSYMTNLSSYAGHHSIIIVMPDASKSFYVNSASDPKAKFEDFFLRDLIPYVDSKFRTIPLPRARAVAGLSMGGYGAAFLGLKHYNRFAALGAFSAAVGIPHEPVPARAANPDAQRNQEQIQALFGTDGSQDRKDRDPFLLVDKVPPAQMPLIYIACGGQDFLLKQNREFVALLAEKKIPYEYREISPRAHTWDFWDDQVQVFLNKLDELPGFRE